MRTRLRVQASISFALGKDDCSQPVDGFSREVYLINGQQPGPSIEIYEGDDLEVFVKNDLFVESTIHWHGKQLDVLSS